MGNNEGIEEIRSRLRAQALEKKRNLYDALDNRKSKFRGCMLGGAVGDALGYVVEFWPEQRIFETYGSGGITRYPGKRENALISDDTQMTLFTANGLILGAVDNRSNYVQHIDECYRDWLKTQSKDDGKPSEGAFSILCSVPELNHCRAPGNTCLSTVGTGASIFAPKNDSKGCGGVMRVAPIGLYFANGPFTADRTAICAAEAAALTHGHELGYLPAAFLAYLIRLLVLGTEKDLRAAVEKTKDEIARLFCGAKYIGELTKKVNDALILSRSTKEPLDVIHALGEGWVGEEALAIALYAALKYDNDFERAIVTAVNHKGDSDSTGAITGNILGAYLGIDAIPSHYLERLELERLINETAVDLFRAAYELEGDQNYKNMLTMKYSK